MPKMLRESDNVSHAVMRRTFGTLVRLQFGKPLSQFLHDLVDSIAVYVSCGLWRFEVFNMVHYHIRFFCVGIFFQCFMKIIEQINHAGYI